MKPPAKRLPNWKGITINFGVHSSLFGLPFLGNLGNVLRSQSFLVQKWGSWGIQCIWFCTVRIRPKLCLGCPSPRNGSIFHCLLSTPHVARKIFLRNIEKSEIGKFFLRGRVDPPYQNRKWNRFC